MVLWSHICDHILTSFIAGSVSRANSGVSHSGAQFWKALLLGYNTKLQDFNEARRKKDLRTIEVRSTANQFSLTYFIKI